MRILKAFNNKGTKNETVDNLTIFVSVMNTSDTRPISELYIITCDDKGNHWNTTFTSNLLTWDNIGTKMNTADLPKKVTDGFEWVFSQITA